MKQQDPTPHHAPEPGFYHGYIETVSGATCEVVLDTGEKVWIPTPRLAIEVWHEHHPSEDGDMIISIHARIKRRTENDER